MAMALAASVGLEPDANAGDAAADALFQSGKALLADGRVAQACEKFEESYKLEPLLGALLNLADCLEKDGRLAAAWSRWGEAAEQAGRASDARKAFAEERRAALEPRLSRLLVEIAGDIGDLEVLRDGQPVGKAAFGVAIPLDPGAHVLEVARGDEVVDSQSLALAEGEQRTVSLDVTRLANAPSIGRRKGAPPPGPTRASVEPPAEAGTPPQLIAGLVVGGTGVAAGIVGFVFGGLALGKQGEADDPAFCTSDHACSPQGVELIASAETFAHVSTGLLAGGGALVGVGLVLVLTAPSGDEAGALDRRAGAGPTLQVGLTPARDALGLDLRGRF